MNASIGQGVGGDSFSFYHVDEFTHFQIGAMGKHQTLNLVVFPDTVVVPSGIYHPVSDIHKIQQITKLLLGQLNVHG